jgi:phosphoribosylglycinamide formyltransferase 1
VVLASGNGSNFQAIAERVAESPHRIVALVCDRYGVPVLERARNLGIEAIVIDYARDRAAAEVRLAEILTDLRPDYIFLAGFMKIISADLVSAFEGRMVNVHPALLPRYPGLNAIERAYAAGDATLGVTIHYVDAGVDTGPIIAQRSIERADGDSLEAVEQRIHEIEHQLFPEVALALLDSVGASQVSGAIR